MLLEIGGDPVRVPIDQRVDLEPPLRVRRVDFEARQIGAGRGLERLAPGKARIVTGKRAFERAHLAQIAAAVRIVGPSEAGLVARLQLFQIGVEIDEIEAEPLCQFVAIGQRFGEVLAGIEEQHRHACIDLRDEMQQRRAFRAEARHHGDIARQRAFEHCAQPVLGFGSAKHPVQPDRVLIGEAGPRVEPVDGAHLAHACLLLQIGVRASAAL